MRRVRLASSVPRTAERGSSAQKSMTHGSYCNIHGAKHKRLRTLAAAIFVFAPHNILHLLVFCIARRP